MALCQFSSREEKIIEIIGKKKVTLEYISSELFKNSSTLDPKIAVANSVSRIIKKCEHHSLNWILHKTRVNNKLFIKRGRR